MQARWDHLPFPLSIREVQMCVRTRTSSQQFALMDTPEIKTNLNPRPRFDTVSILAAGWRTAGRATLARAYLPRLGLSTFNQRSSTELKIACLLVSSLYLTRLKVCWLKTCSRVFVKSSPSKSREVSSIREREEGTRDGV